METPNIIEALPTDPELSANQRMVELGRAAARLMLETGLAGQTILDHVEFYLVRESFKLGCTYRRAADFMGVTYGTMNNRMDRYFHRRSELALDKETFINCEAIGSRVLHNGVEVGQV